MGFVQGAVGLVVIIILTVSLVMPTIKNANTSGWSASEIAVFASLGVVVIVGLINSVATAYGLNY